MRAACLASANLVRPPSGKHGLTMVISGKRLFLKESLLSALLFCMAFIITCIFHEAGHAFLVRCLGLQGRWYHNRVDYNYEQASLAQGVWVCLGGSLFTAVQMALCYPLSLRLRKGGRVLRLFLCWMAFWSVIQLLGYFVIGSFPLWNDISGVYNLLNVPWMLRIGGSVTAFVLFRFLLNPLAKPVIAALDASVTTDIREQARVVVLVPSLIAAPILVLINLPAEHLLSLAYPLSVPLFVISTYFRIATAKGVHLFTQQTPRFALWLAGSLLLGLIVLFRMLSYGVAIG